MPHINCQSILFHFIHIIRVRVTGTVGKVVEMLQKRSNHPGVLSTWKGRLLKYSLVSFHSIAEDNQYLYGGSERVGTDSALFVIKAQPDVHYNVDYVHRPPNFCQGVVLAVHGYSRRSSWWLQQRNSLSLARITII